MARGNHLTYVSSSELPIFNGIAIDSIWHKYDSFREKHTDRRYKDSTDYYELTPHWRKDPTIRVKELPEDFKKFFGQQIINGTQTFVNHIRYRTSDSGHASHDDTISIGNFYLYRGFDYFEPNYMIEKGSELADNLLNTLNKKYTIEPLPFGYDVDFPQTFLRRVDNFYYPDAEIPSWRWLHGMPYVTLDGGKNLRVFFEQQMMHVFLQKLDRPVKKGDDNLIKVTFPYGQHGKNAEQECFISHWSERKAKDPNGIIRYRIDSMNRDNRHCKAVATLNDKDQFKRDEWINGIWYELVMIRNVESPRHLL